jgi:hypothetical protein
MHVSSVAGSGPGAQAGRWGGERVAIMHEDQCILDTSLGHELRKKDTGVLSHTRGRVQVRARWRDTERESGNAA